MEAKASSGHATARRVWSFGRCEFDESRWTLTVDGAPVDIEGKPLDILLELLGHAGEVVTKGELMESVWPGVTVAEGSLTTAMSKLRRAIGDTADQVIVTVPRIGYRLAGPVSVRLVESADPEPSPFAAGMALPRRPHWRFSERLGLTRSSEVWRIEHDKTREARVVKYARDADGLRALKREVTLSRLMREALGPRPDLVPIIEWDFSAHPHHLESAWGGPDLPHWVERRGGATAIPLATRLELVASVATTVAAAHELAILHKDLKPANILVEDLSGGGVQAKVVDFGSAALTDPEQLDAMGITRTGVFAGEGPESARSGTLIWMAPELLAGGAATTASDVFALGVILYQVVVGDLRRPFAPGWEADVDDPLLREDIAAAAASNPQSRLRTAEALAERLRTLDARRLARNRLIETEARAQAAEARLARLRARRPWLATASATLVLAAAATATLYIGAARDRDAARRQSHITEVVNRFLADDLIGRASPFKSAGPDESLLTAVKTAAGAIDRRFAAEPAVAARLHQALANALDKRSDWADARAQYGLAIAAWERAQGAGSPDATVTRLQQATMESRSYEQGSAPRAAALIAAAAPRIGPRSRPDLNVWLASARGMAALVGNDGKTAEREFAAACAAAERLPSFSPAARLTLRQRLAFTKFRLGDGAGAEALFRDLARDFAAEEGPDGPNGLMVGMNIAQALMVQGRHAEAVAQANATYPALRARLGDDHEMTLQLVTTRAQSEGMLERWDEAIRDDLLVHAAAVRKQGPKSFFAIATLSDAATAQCRSGRVAEGARNAGEAHALALAAFGKAALTDATAYTLAECQIAAGQPALAARSLEGIDRAAVAQLAADPNWGANVDLALARIALAQGRKAEARTLLDRAAPAFRLKSADPFLVRTWRTLDQAT